MIRKIIIILIVVLVLSAVSLPAIMMSNFGTFISFVCTVIGIVLWVRLRSRYHRGLALILTLLAVWSLIDNLKKLI